LSIPPTTITRSHMAWFRFTVNSNNDFPSNKGRYCLGLDLRDKGQSLLPTPPDKITFMILIPWFPKIKSKDDPLRKFNAKILVCKVATDTTKAMLRFQNSKNGFRKSNNHTA